MLIRAIASGGRAALCIEQGMVGLKLWTGTFCDEPCVYPVIEAAIELELPIMVHTFHKVVSPIRYESKPINVVNLARRYPEAKLIMAHWAGMAQRREGRRALPEHLHGY